MKDGFGRGLCSVGGVCAAGVVSTVFATTSLAAEAQQLDASIGGLDEIVVTARKREETAQKVPVAVAVFSAEDIERYNLTSLENMAGSTPELFIARVSNGSGAQITLRGVGSQSTSIGIEQSTAVVVDGVYYGSGFFLNEALFDLQSFEVLKGPQALFFGKNATAGVVSINTASPTDEFEALTRLSYEFESETVGAQAIVSGPLTDTLRGRLAVRGSNMADGYFENRAVGEAITFLDLATGDLISRFQQPNNGGTPGSSEVAVRGTLIWEPSDRFTAKLKANWSKRDDATNAWNYVPVACGNGTGFTQVNPAVPCKRDFVVYIPNAPDGVSGNIPDAKRDGSSYNEYKAWAVTADFAYQLDQSTISSIFNYNWSRNLWGLGQNVQSPTSYIAASQNSELSVFSNETRWQTDFSGPVNFLIGAYYQNTSRDHTQAAAFAPLEDSSLPLNRRFVSYIKPATVDGETFSGFAQATWRIVPTLELSAGARYIDETVKGFLEQSYVQSALQGLFPENSPITSDQSFEEWTPEISLTYFPSDNLTMYAGYKSAYKSGGFSASALVVAATVPEDIAFLPETAEGFDAGVKATLLDNQLRLNLNIYRTEYKDLQVDFFNSVTFQFITTNAGKAKVEGVEVSGEYAPRSLPGLRLTGVMNYNKAEYEEYIAPCYAGQSIAAGCNTVFGGVPGQDLGGKPLAMAPEWTGAIGGSYLRPFGTGYAWEFGANLRYSGDYLASSFGAPLSKQDSYVNLDASVTLSGDDGQWDLSLIGRNLTNSFRISTQLDLPNSGSGTGTAVAVPADQIGIADLPRRIMLQYTHRF